jgi:hypothetical protein
MRRLPLTLVLVALAGLLSVLPSDASPTPTADADAAPGLFELVGHEPLMNRGMNAALAVHGNYAYVGARTDAKANNVNHMGLMVVNIADPTKPTIAKEMVAPLEGNKSESSRELRVWKSQDILIVLHTNCGEIHACTPSSVNSFRFYDISGANAADPKLILQFGKNTHEFYLWQDPNNPDRALMYAAGAGSSLQVYDLSPLLEGKEPKTLYNATHKYNSGGLHSMSVSNDGTRGYYALLTGGFAVVDLSDFAKGVAAPTVRPITVSASRPTWAGPGAHSAIKLWNSNYAYVADEVYGEAAKALGAHGCPWGWARLIDLANPAAPQVKAEYKLPQNNPDFCTTDVPRPFSSYSAHNPTATPSIVFTSWHSGGLQAIDVTDPTKPTQLAQYLPTPLLYVLQEDPILSAGQDKVVMWSYPIIKDGLIYITDIRNGLYILRYKGPHADEVANIDFLEGNSNQGDALCFDPVLKTKVNPDDPDEYIVPEYCTAP